MYAMEFIIKLIFFVYNRAITHINYTGLFNVLPRSCIMFSVVLVEKFTTWVSMLTSELYLLDAISD